MADPVTIALIGSTLATTFIDVQSQRANIKGLEQQAGVRSELANQQFIADTKEAGRTAATQRARFAAQGLSFSGSSLLVQEEQASSSDFNARMRRFGTLNEGVHLLNDADQLRTKRSQTLIGAGSSLLRGIDAVPVGGQSSFGKTPSLTGSTVPVGQGKTVQD